MLDSERGIAVTGNFDDFKKKHEQEERDRETIAKETTAEWEILKGEVSKFAIDRKTCNGYPFSWFPEPGCAKLILNDVAAFLFDGRVKNGVPEGYRIRFDRRPPGAGRQFIDDNPIPVETWSLEPIIEAGNFRWAVAGRGKQSSAELAEETAKQLSKHHIAYESAFGRAS